MWKEVTLLEVRARNDEKKLLFYIAQELATFRSKYALKIQHFLHELQKIGYYKKAQPSILKKEIWNIDNLIYIKKFMFFQMMILLSISSVFLICGATHGLIYRKAGREELDERMEPVVNMHHFFFLLLFPCFSFFLVRFSFLSLFFVSFFLFEESKWNCTAPTREMAWSVYSLNFE